MKLKHLAYSAVAAAAALSSCAALAQASPTNEGMSFRSGANAVTLYGLIDVTFSHRSNADTAQHSVNGYQEAWFSGNRWGLTGTHDLGADGLGAIFRLESEFNFRNGVNPDSPSQFNRDAWLGLQSNTLGKLTFGRQNTLARDFSQNYGDPYGRAQTSLDEGGWTNNNSFKHLIFYAGSASSTRYNDGLVWKKKIGPWVAGLGYQFGGIPGDASRGSTRAAALAYNGQDFNLSGFVNSANVAGYSHHSYSLGGNVQLNKLIRLNAGVFRYNADQVASAMGRRKDTAYTLSAKFTPEGKFDYELGYQRMHAENATVDAQGYVFNAFANASGASGAVATGNRNSLYGSAFYHFDNSTEVYVAFDRLVTTDSYKAASALGAKNQTGVGVGMRFRF